MLKNYSGRFLHNLHLLRTILLYTTSSHSLFTLKASTMRTSCTCKSVIIKTYCFTDENMLKEIVQTSRSRDYNPTNFFVCLNNVINYIISIK